MDGRSEALFAGLGLAHCRARAPSEGQHSSAVAEYFALRQTGITLALRLEIMVD